MQQIQPDCYYGGITLPRGKKGWAVYRDGREIERYAMMRGTNQHFILL